MKKTNTFSVTYYDLDFNPKFVGRGMTYQNANHRINEFVEATMNRVITKREHEQIHAGRERVEFETLEGFFYIDKE